MITFFSTEFSSYITPWWYLQYGRCDHEQCGLFGKCNTPGDQNPWRSTKLILRLELTVHLYLILILGYTQTAYTSVILYIPGIRNMPIWWNTQFNIFALCVDYCKNVICKNSHRVMNKTAHMPWRKRCPS